MSYEVVVRPDAKNYLPSDLPDEFLDAIESAFAAISDNPRKAGHHPSCPPHAYGGWLYITSVDMPERRYYIRLFFEIDEERKAVGITHLSMQPRWPAEMTPQFPSPIDDDDDVINIPQS